MNHLWQSTLFVIVAWLATLALRGNGARLRYWLWTAASVKFFVPLSVLVSLGELFQWRDAPVAVQPAVSFVMEDVLMPATIVAVAPATVSPSAPVWPWLVPAVWFAGALVVIASWWRQWTPIRSALRRATPLRFDPEYDTGDLELMSSPSMPEPGVVGILRPRLLLPEGIVERLTPAQLRSLIAHERCHIECHDNLVAAIHMAVEAIFWFHPAVWWIEKQLVDERERACDEAVLMAGSRPQDYAEGILEVCRQSVGARLACAAGVSGSNLRARRGDHAERDRASDDAQPAVGPGSGSRHGGRGACCRRRTRGSVAGRRSTSAGVRKRICHAEQAARPGRARSPGPGSEPDEARDVSWRRRPVPFPHWRSGQYADSGGVQRHRLASRGKSRLGLHGSIRDRRTNTGRRHRRSEARHAAVVARRSISAHSPARNEDDARV
jgi:beta-lactamase regulating signal transducer with metallopeptidase domain